MNKCIFACLLILLPGILIPVFAQNLKKFYTYEVQVGGDLVFIYPFEGYENIDDKSAFTFDITWKAGKDTAVINFSFFTREPVSSSVLEVSSDTYNAILTTKRIFIDFEKRWWHHRYSAVISVNELIAISKLNTPPMFIIRTDKGVLKYHVKQRKWEKYSRALDKILYIRSLPG